MRSLRARYEAGASVPLLAASCGYSTSTVYRLLHQAGTTMRPRSQPNPGTAGDRPPWAPLPCTPMPHGPQAAPAVHTGRSTSYPSYPVTMIGTTP